jgi:hypothetical protein
MKEVRVSSSLREILVSAGVALMTLSIFAAAIAVGLLVGTGTGRWWAGATAALAFLAFVILPFGSGGW